MTKRNVFMTPFSKFRVLALGSGFAAMAVLATLAQTGRAQAASGLSQCTGSSRQSVINCCNRFVAGHPQLWMHQSHTSCRQAVGCTTSRMSFTSAKIVKKCSVLSPNNVSNSKEHEPKDKQSISDIRLKTDVHRIGTTVLGLPLYTFQYRNQPGVYVGVMAQDVLKVEPSAVSIGANGYYLVDYGKLGIAMERIQ